LDTNSGTASFTLILGLLLLGLLRRNYNLQGLLLQTSILWNFQPNVN